MKRTISVFVSILLLLLLHAQPVKKYGQLQVKGTQLCDAKGNLVVLRGMSFGWHNFWPRFFNQDAVAWLAKNWHCSVVHAAMGIEPKGGYKQESGIKTKAFLKKYNKQSNLHKTSTGITNM